MMSTYGNSELDELFEDVRDAMRWAKLVAFDGCHKIYLAMDEGQAEWFRGHYNGEECGDLNFSGTPEEMFAMVQKWWNESCGLRFIEAVKTDPSDPSGTSNDSFETLIPQGDWSFDDEEEEEEY